MTRDTATGCGTLIVLGAFVVAGLAILAITRAVGLW